MRCLVVAAAVLTPTIAAADGTPREFLPEVSLIYKVAACGPSTATVDSKLDKIVEAHCKSLRPYLDKFKTDMLDKAHAWFVEHLPKNLPREVVYPFGGGDLISALVPFPDAPVITTISLELAGDPRAFGKLAPAEYEKHLYEFRKVIGPAINIGLNSSVNLSAGQRQVIPAQLTSHLLGLSAEGAELTSVKFFGLDDAGAIHYLTAEDIEGDVSKGKSLSGNWKDPAFAKSFANVEVSYKKPGDATVHIHRHIAWNLANDYLKTHPQLLAHLDAKGKVTHLTKGGVYLLWENDFSTIRKHILDHLTFLVSDSTGIPPKFATAAGMVQEPFGKFDGPMLKDSTANPATADFIKLWKTAPPVPFRFGYVDASQRNHLLFTHPK